jgi:valyl-tRNA synthetase
MNKKMTKIVYINTPPPTISGNLHIGHIFSYTHIDVINRIEKYLGNKVNFPIGFDCNGIPTEKLLQNTNKSINDFCQDYIKLFKIMGYEMGYDFFYKTIDCDAKLIFFQLTQKGLIYKAKKEIWFDTFFNTPLSNNEVIEKNGKFIGEVSKKPVIKKQVEHYFLRTVEFKNRLLELAKLIEFYPDFMINKLIDWIENLNQDWCITRDRDFGIKIEDKVFDTWFISALTFNKFNKQSDYHFQSHEIIRSWCFYSLVMSMHLYDNIPFKKVFISGWCVDKNKNKLSKSLNNTIDPLILIDKYGVNPIRFWACKSDWGCDTHFDQNVLLNGRRFITKFINAKKFFEMRAYVINDDHFFLETQGILNMDYLTYEPIIKLFQNHRIKESLELFYKDFFEFCDVEIEKCKIDNSLTEKSFTKLLQFYKIYKVFFNIDKQNLN